MGVMAVFRKLGVGMRWESGGGESRSALAYRSPIGVSDRCFKRIEAQEG